MKRKPRSRCAQPWLLVAACAFAHAPAHGQDAEHALEPAEGAADSAEPRGAAPSTAAARSHFQRGVDYYTEGDLAAALVEFQRAYKLQPTYRLLYNLGQVAYEQRDYAAAERYFRKYLVQGGDEIDAKRRAEVEQELMRLEERVADVELLTNQQGASLFVDDHPVGQAPLAVPVRVSAGRRKLRAELAGHQTVIRMVDVVGGEPQTMRLDFGPERGVQLSTGERGSSGTGNAAIWTGVATAALGLGTAGMALWADSDQRSYDKALERTTTRGELNELADRTEQKALITDILLGATLVTGAITLVLLLVDDDGDGDDDERAPAKSAVQIGAGSVRAAF